MIKSTIIKGILLSLIMISCQKDKGNRMQIKTTHENFECYKKLIEYLTTNNASIEEALDIRNLKPSGKRDVVTCKSEYRLIEPTELSDMIPENWNQDCLHKLQSKNDLLGIRFLSNCQIIIEIDRMQRSSKLSSTKTIEIHRLYYGIIPNDNNFKYGTEKVINTMNLDEKWTYEISQIKTIHGVF